MRRRRPQMTLSFGVDTTQKTLMFATDSPFLLNDCQDIDPSLPLDRQEYVIFSAFSCHCIHNYQVRGPQKSEREQYQEPAQRGGQICDSQH